MKTFNKDIKNLINTIECKIEIDILNKMRRGNIFLTEENKTKAIKEKLIEKKSNKIMIIKEGKWKTRVILKDKQ